MPRRQHTNESFDLDSLSSGRDYPDLSGDGEDFYKFLLESFPNREFDLSDLNRALRVQGHVTKYNDNGSLIKELRIMQYLEIQPLQSGERFPKIKLLK